MRNKQKRKEYKKKYRIEHREEIKEYEKRYRTEHREEIRKKSKKYHLIRGPERSDRARNLIYQIKLMGCYFCGESDMDVLDFAHVNDKIERTKGGKRKSYITGIKPFFNRVEKCEVMCKNCHTKFDLGKLKIKGE